MKKSIQFTNDEKIVMFDQVHKMCLNEFNDAAEDDELDRNYFWEEVIGKFLELTKEDWRQHNKGRRIK